MPVNHYPGSPEEKILPYWSVEDPSMEDFENLVHYAGDRKFFNLIVSGTPKEVSPDWLAKHPGWQEGDYDYAASYSIYKDDVEWMLNESEDPMEALNAYLEGTGKEWIEISELKIVDREEPYGDTF